MRRISRTALVITASALTPCAWAAPAVTAAGAATELLQRRDTLSFGTSSTIDVTRDVLSLTFSTTDDASDALSVQRDLKGALDQALEQARKVARPGEIDVHTGSFSLVPHYSIRGSIDGWQGTASLVIEGKDIAGIGALSANIRTMTISSASYRLSREARQKAEAQLSTEAIAHFRELAADYARQFGYRAYDIGEVNVTSANDLTSTALPMLRRNPLAVSSAEPPLPTEAGKASVSVNVAGSVIMSR